MEEKIWKKMADLANPEMKYVELCEEITKINKLVKLLRKHERK